MANIYTRKRPNDRFHRPAMYENEVIRDAVDAVVDVERYDIAQQVLEAANSDLCLPCLLKGREYISETTVELASGALVQVCSNCSIVTRDL